MSTQLNQWTLADGAVVDTDFYRSGSRSTNHPVVAGPATLGKQTSEDVGMASGQPHTVTFWAYRNAATTDIDIEVYHYPDNDSTPVLVTTFDQGDLTDDAWTQLTTSVTPNRGANTIEIVTKSGATPMTDPDLWIDSVEFEIASLSLTRRLREALLTDMRGVTKANGFRRELKTVRSEPTVPTEIRGPAAFLHDGSYVDTQPETTCGRKAMHYFLVMVYVEHKDGVETIDDLVDDIRNAVEISNSTVHSMSEVIMAGITSVQEPLPDEDVSEDAHVRLLTVAVEYMYTEGSL